MWWNERKYKQLKDIVSPYPSITASRGESGAIYINEGRLDASNTRRLLKVYLSAEHEGTTPTVAIEVRTGNTDKYSPEHATITLFSNRQRNKPVTFNVDESHGSLGTLLLHDTVNLALVGLKLLQTAGTLPANDPRYTDLRSKVIDVFDAPGDLNQMPESRVSKENFLPFAITTLTRFL